LFSTFLRGVPGAESGLRLGDWISGYRFLTFNGPPIENSVSSGIYTTALLGLRVLTAPSIATPDVLEPKLGRAIHGQKRSDVIVGPLLEMPLGGKLLG